MAPHPPNVGIIGYGSSARTFHIPLLSALPSLTLYAIAQRHPTPSNDAAADHPSIKTYRSAEALIQDPRVDVVIVTTIPDSHFEIAKRALEGGKHGW